MQQKTIAFQKAYKAAPEQTLSREQLLISKYLNGLTFGKQFRGVDEKQVWQALEKLTELYEDALTVERSRRELLQRQLEALQSRREEDHGPT